MAKKQNVPAIVSGMGVALALVDGITKRVRRLGGTDKDIHRLVTDAGAATLDQIAALIVGKGETEATRAAISHIVDVYKLVIRRSRPLADQIAAGRYDWIDPGINRQNFPGAEGNTDEEAEVVLFHFNRVMSSDAVIEEIAKEGYEPEELPGLLAFGATKPELQRQFPIIALGSVWVNPSGDRRVSSLGEYSGLRGLYLGQYVDEWIGRCRFLGRRKRR